MHASLTRLAFIDYEHKYIACRICFLCPRACPLVHQDIQKLLDQRTIMITYDRNHDDDKVNVIVLRFNVPKPVEIIYDCQKTSAFPLVISLSGPVPYKSDKAIPYKYNATMIEDNVEVPFPSVVNIANVSRVTRSGHVFSSTPPRRTKDVIVGKTQVEFQLSRLVCLVVQIRRWIMIK